ncbi:S-layer homology domain-containing protein [Saccharibacillus alkalitolerans]|uniref:S-layer homology domain-containing protein n=1 Tax=Saccharibacillus alkalitolerans TaxID=2705290 RepID=A0ABX0F4Z2_9BACL|nr:S-layer homology domain-containing protein [Saccharibacillus alkalitolerans]NGZ75084.1 S-layer homology domain-containing protein [Saccharibacillus alkalitolerans]
MKSKPLTPKRVGPSLAALLLGAGLLFPAPSYASASPAAFPEAAGSGMPAADAAALRVSVTDAVTRQPLDGVTLTLYWADTAGNRSAGRVPGRSVFAGPLPREGGGAGRYERTVPAEADYYVVGEKAGYLTFDSRNQNAAGAAGGVLRVGGAGADYAFAMTPAAHKYPAYMSGYTDGLFRPEQNVTRVELAAILQRSMGQEYAAADMKFRDVEPGKWSAASVAFVTANGWMQGTGADRFEPNREVSRAELARILANVFGWSAESGGSGTAYKDTDGHWASGAIAAAAAHGALSGYPDGSFRPDRAVTRAEIAALINRLIGRPADAGLPMTWSDVPPSYWAYGDVMAASIDHTPSGAR